MQKSEQQARVSAVREYLASIGHSVTQVQGYEIVARGMGLKNKHVLASSAVPGASPVRGAPSQVVLDAKTVPVMALTDAAYTPAQMAQGDWTFDVVIPFALDQLDTIDAMNDYASMRITGSEVALEDITFNHVPEVNYGKGWVAYRVTGYVSSPEDHFEEVEGYADKKFYADLKDLATRIQGNADVVLAFADETLPRSFRVKTVNAAPRMLLWRYAQESGANNEAVNEMEDDWVCELEPYAGASDPTPVRLRLGDLKYASRTDEGAWHVSMQGRVVTLAI